ncbi:AraC family transcriptional regulator [Actinomadura miaoliensis]|uniref:AraC family transcriptional regulator n=2 Tax=Actinomadura miaoliensis TaxID=430685 RepID=A0ABP7UZM8_9ACTN
MLSFAGRLGGTAAHAHAAVQVVTLTAGTVVFRDRYGGRQRAAAAIIPAGVVHAVEAPNPVDGQAYGTTCYLDPAGRAAAAVAARVRAAGDRHQVSAWIAAAADTSADQLLVMSHDLGAQVTRAGLHPAVAAVLASASQRPPDPGGPALPASLTEAATAVGLSATRLGHLFTEQLGLPYTAWRRWVRLQHAMAAVQEGATLTHAAHAAGFTDSAHLTRVCRAMFGITPTQAARAAGWHPHRRRQWPGQQLR